MPYWAQLAIFVIYVTISLIGVYMLTENSWQSYDYFQDAPYVFMVSAFIFALIGGILIYIGTFSKLFLK